MTLVVAVSLGQANANNSTTAQLESRKLDGQWDVVYIEMDNKNIEKKDFGNVTISGNKLTCRHDGKEKSWTLEFGPHHQIRTEETTSTSTKAEDRHCHGVYIASKDYLCFSMNHGRDDTTAAGRTTGNANTTTTSTTDHNAYGSHFVMILRRAGSTAGR